MLELMASMASRSFADMTDLKEKNPDQYESFIQSIVRMLNATTEMLRDSPELRQAFAEVHMEFMRHPEMQQTVAAAKEALARLP